MKKALVILLIIYLFMQLYLPGVAEDRIKEGLMANIDQVEGLEVDARSFPAWEILFSQRVDHLKIEADWLVLEQLRLDSFRGEYKNVSYGDQVIYGKNTDLSVNISEDSLNKYVNDKYSSFNNFKVNLEPENVHLAGHMDFLDARIKVQLSGKLTLADINEIAFEPGKFSVEEVDIPVSLLKKFVRDLGFTLDLNQYNIPLMVEDLRVSNDQLILEGGTTAGRTVQ